MCQLGRNLILAYFIALTFAVSTIARAEYKTDYKQAAVDVEANDQLMVKNYFGSVQLLHKAGAKHVTLDLTRTMTEKDPEAEVDWNVRFRKIEKTIEVIVEGPSSKAKWTKALRKSKELPRFNMTITAPSLPAQLFVGDGDVTVKAWKAPLKLFAKSGAVTVRDMHADLMIFKGEGNLTVKNHIGALEIESYQSQVSLSEIKGRVELENFAGHSVLDNVDGSLFLSSFKGNTRVDRGQGKIEFTNGRGHLKVSKFNGSLLGSNGQGEIHANLSSTSQVRIKSEDGEVNLRLPGSGARVNLGSKKGYIHAPKFLKLTRLPNLKLMRGQLRGSKSGQVYVRTTSGTIRLR